MNNLFRTSQTLFILLLVLLLCNVANALEISDMIQMPFSVQSTANTQSIFSIDELSMSILDEAATNNATTNDADISDTVADSLIPAVLLSNVYNYPNPFSSVSGTSIGYKLPKDMALTIKGYSLRGYEVFSISCPAGGLGGSSGYNKVPFTERLTPGIYYYLVIYEGQVLGKSKMLIKS